MNSVSVGLHAQRTVVVDAHSQRTLSANRREYDARRRRSRDSEATHAYKQVLGFDPCFVCGERVPGRVNDRDHIEPLITGGRDDWSNLTAACRGHNRGRREKPVLLYLLEVNA